MPQTRSSKPTAAVFSGAAPVATSLASGACWLLSGE
jgi:hypothetical protein